MQLSWQDLRRMVLTYRLKKKSHFLLKCHQKTIFLGVLL